MIASGASDKILQFSTFKLFYFSLFNAKPSWSIKIILLCLNVNYVVEELVVNIFQPPPSIRCNITQKACIGECDVKSRASTYKITFSMSDDTISFRTQKNTKIMRQSRWYWGNKISWKKNPNEMFVLHTATLLFCKLRHKHSRLLFKDIWLISITEVPVKRISEFRIIQGQHIFLKISGGAQKIPGGARPPIAPP